MESWNSVFASVVEFLGSPINLGRQASVLLNPTPAANRSIDTESRKRWTCDRPKKKRQQLFFMEFARGFLVCSLSLRLVYPRERLLGHSSPEGEKCPLVA